MLQTGALLSSGHSPIVAVDGCDAMTQNTNKSGDLLSQSMSYLQKVLLGNEQLQFERSGSKDEDSWIGGSTAYSSYLSRQRPLLPYSRPTKEAKFNRDDAITGLSIDSSQYPVRLVTGRGIASNRVAYISRRVLLSHRRRQTWSLGLPT